MVVYLNVEKYVNEYVEHHKKQPLMDIACEVADIILHDLHPNTQHWVESLYEPNTTVFNEASQKLYDAIYDEVFAYLEEKYRFTKLCKYRQEQEIQCILEDTQFALQVSLHDHQSQTFESGHLSSGIESPSYNQSSAIYMSTDKTLNGKRKIILSLDPQVHWSKFYLVGGIDHNDLELAQKTVALLTDLINGDAEWDNLNDCLKGNA